MLRETSFQRSIFLLLFVVAYGRLHAQTLKSHADPAVVRLRQDKIAAAKVFPLKDFAQYIPYWTAEGGWHTELQLRNNLSADSLTVTPALRTPDGTETPLQPLTLLPGEVRSVMLNEALAAVNSNLAGQANAYGSIALRYKSKGSRNLYASAMVHDTGHPIMYHLDGQIESPGFHAGSREGIWWLPSKSTRDYLIVSNQSGVPLIGTLWLYDAAGKPWKQAVTLGPRQSQRLAIRDLVSRAGFTSDHGGIKLDFPDGAGSSDSVHILFDEVAGFSATMKMFDADARVTLSERDYAHHGKWVTRAPMLALTTPDPALELPAWTQLQPMLLVRNTTAVPAKTDIQLHWRGATDSGRASLPAFTLSPFETKLIRIDNLQASGLLPLTAYWAQVSIATDTLPDQVMAVAASYDSTLRYGAQTPFSDQMTGHLEGGQWQADGLHNSLIAAGNGGSKPVTANLTIFYDQGRRHYTVEKIIGADDQWFVDVRQLIRGRVPDKDGYLLPASLTLGAYQLREVGLQPQNSLYEGKVITDKTFGHATYGCMVCCGYSGDAGPAFLINDPTQVGISQTVDVGVYAPNACSGSVDFVGGFFDSWSTDNASVMTASNATVQGINFGSTRIRTHASSLPSGQGQDQRAACPVAPAQTDGGGQSVPTITQDKTLYYFGAGGSQPANFYLGGTPATFTATGASGGSSSWTVTGGKATFASDGSTRTSTTTSGNTVQVYGLSGSSSALDQTLSLAWTPAGQSQSLSANDTFNVDVPYKLVQFAMSGPDAVANCSPNFDPGEVGWHSQYDWQMMDNFGHALTGMSFNESFTDIVQYQSTNLSFVPNGGPGMYNASRFNDDYCYANGTVGVPKPQVPQNPLGNNKIDSATQTYRLGSATVGSGMKVQTQTLTRYVDHPTLTNIVSPVP